MNTLNMIKTITAIGFATSILGCNSDSGGSATATSASNSALAMSKYDINAYPSNKVVCDPWGGESPSALEHGVKATLFYKTASQPIYGNVLDMVSKTKMSDQSLFFSDINVPTRLFQTGFATQTSSVVKNDDGQMLIEYFSLKFDTDIVLGPQDEEGTYQFAILSDDGARMSITNAQGQKTEIINNDGNHPTKMGCATTTQTFTKSTRLSTEVLYYQGPRYHIANVVMWRKIPTGTTPTPDVLCGQSGNSYFFDPNNGSVPLKPYNDLLARGWKPLTKDNYVIPSSGKESDDTVHMAYNPCFQGTAPIITAFLPGEILLNDAFFYWNTDIPATTQVLITEVATGDTILTTADNLLSTTHQVHVTGLKSSTNYQAQAISVSSNMGKTISSTIDFRTGP